MECEEYNSVNYIGLFIGKKPNNSLCEPKKINYKIKNLYEDIDIEILFNKLAFYNGEEIKYIIKTNLKYTFKLRDIFFRQILYRNIKWKGYMKNSLLDKKIFLDTQMKYQKEPNSEDEDILQYIGEEIISGILGTGIGAISGTIIGGIICPHLLIGMLSGGILASFIGSIGGLFSYSIYHDYSPGNKSLSRKTILSSSKHKNNINKEQIKKEIQKFVYFKDNKIVGFIKFINNIAPPVNGYYFKCYYNLKFDVKISNCIQDTNKNVLKNEIDFNLELNILKI